MSKGVFFSPSKKESPAGNKKYGLSLFSHV